MCNRGFVHVHHWVVLLGKHSVLGGLLAQLGDLPLQGPNGALQRVDLSLLALGGTVLVDL